MSNEELLSQLRAPFHPTHITWKPQATTKDQTKAMACAYGDLRAYQNRLDEVCGMDWSVTYTPWGETKVVCHLTIGGVTRSSTGESDSQSERSEIGGTAAEAQAFKRAAAMFGLGRYLYELPSVWVEYDPNAKGFTDKAKAKLEGIIVQHYRCYMGQNENQQAATPTPTTAPNKSDDNSALIAKYNELGKTLYGEQWPQVSRHNIERISGGASTEDSGLTPEQLQKLIDGMLKLQKKTTKTQNDKTEAKEEKSKAFKAFQAEGANLFNGSWNDARHWLIERYTKRYTPDNVRTSANDLTDAELVELSTAIKSHGATLKSDFSKQPAKETA